MILLFIMACKGHDYRDSGDFARESASPESTPSTIDSAESFDTQSEDTTQGGGDSDSGCGDTGDPSKRDRYSPGPWLDVSCSKDGVHCCGLRVDGSVSCWGAFDRAPCGAGFRDVTAGYWYSCAQAATGEISCWGDLSQQGSEPPDGVFAAFDSYYGSSCALDMDGNAVCWGWVDQDASAYSGIFTTVGVGEAGACATDTSGDAGCWGAYLYGWVTGPFTMVAVGTYTGVGLGADGILQVWQDDGDNTIPHCGEHEDVPTDPMTFVDMGYHYGCAVAASDGHLECWGYDDECDRLASVHDHGQTRPPPGSFVKVSTGALNACAIDVDGGMTCWGNDAYYVSSPPD